MNATPYYFELKNLLTQFVAAFDGILIKRFNSKTRHPEETIQVRYIYAPKERVLFDIVNKAQNMTLPCVSITMNSLSRDESRVFNKLDGLYLPTTQQTHGKLTTQVKMPVPVNIGISMSIMTNYQTDMDQIISNFVPYNNPYIIIAWQLPAEFATAYIQEIRSEVLWDNNISFDYSIEKTASTKPRIVADTNFTIKGWLFPDTIDDPHKNIFFINADFNAISNQNLLTLDNYYQLSAVNYVYPLSAGLINDTEFVNLSAAPQISNLFFSTSAGTFMLDRDYTIGTYNRNGTITLQGGNFQYTKNVLLSSGSSLFGTTTAINSTYYGTVSGEVLSESRYTIISPNILNVTFPTLTGSGYFDIIINNEAGWSSTINTGYHLYSSV